MNVLSVKECLSFGWNTFRSRPWIFIQVGLLLFLVNMLVNLMQTGLDMSGSATGGGVAILVALISTLIGIGVSFLISMGETAFFLKAHDDTRAAGIGDLWHPKPFVKFALASLLAGIIILVGLILLIVPGVIAAILFMFVAYLVIDQGLGPVDALKKSVELTKGNRWNLFWLSLALLGINILGVLALLIGLFVTIPVSFLASVYAYRTLSRTGKETDTVVVDTEAVAVA